MQSGSGKTIASCGLMLALKRRGFRTVGLKSGPDYIDPMFHTRITGIPARNLDMFMQGEDGVRRTISRSEGDIAVIEGAMGYYDGLNKSTEASAWDVARVTETPAILILRPKGQGLTLAANACGMLAFRKPCQIKAFVLNDIKPALFGYYKDMLEKETGLPVLGFIPHLDEAGIESRHLGLVEAEEIEDFDKKCSAVAEAWEENTDIDGLLKIADIREEHADIDGLLKIENVHEEHADIDGALKNADVREEHAYIDGVLKTEDIAGKYSHIDKSSVTVKEEPVTGQGAASDVNHVGKSSSHFFCRIAIARDKAFSFYYQDNLDALQEAGAEIVFFSPMTDHALPAADGLYLGGGYPELYAETLSGNIEMRDSIRKAILSGMPVVAECGGFLYLQQELEGQYDRGFLQQEEKCKHSLLKQEEKCKRSRLLHEEKCKHSLPRQELERGHKSSLHADPAKSGKTDFEMVGILPGRGYRTGAPVRFGYLKLHAEEDSLLFRRGEQIPAHEFHYWDSTDCGSCLTAVKPGRRSWKCGFASKTMYAAFPHLHWGGEIPMAERFVSAAVHYKYKRDNRTIQNPL